MDLIFSYSYYGHHPMEWNAICLGKAGWEGRAFILDWHMRFTPFFQEYSRKFGTISTLDKLQVDLSQYIHGIPASGLPTMTSLNRTDLDAIDVTPVLLLVERVDDAMNSFLVGVFHDLLSGLSVSDYRSVLAGIERDRLAESGITIPAP